MEFVNKVVKMLSAQLKEEEESYEQALNSKQVEFWRLKEIQQRIKSLKQSLTSIDKLSTSNEASHLLHFGKH
jgi:hypothetical protein